MRSDSRIRIYPQYLSADLTRAEGRRVSKKNAIKDLTILEIKIAAQKLGYVVEIDPNKKYSRQWFTSAKGLLYLQKDNEQIPKTQLLAGLSKTITEFARPLIIEKQKEKQRENAKTSKKPVKKKFPKDSRSKGRGQQRRSVRRR